MTRSEDRRLVIVLVSGMLIVVATMVVALFVVTRRPVVLVMPGDSRFADLGDSDTSLAGPPGSTVLEITESVAPPDIVVRRVSRVPDTQNPLDNLWSRIPGVEVNLEAQTTASPPLDQVSVSSVIVQAARDDDRISWRLSWDQPTRRDSTNVADFSDAVAIQFPLADGAPYTMGGPDMPVLILYWKALWQRDIEQGFQDVSTIYPNSWNDFYWFADGNDFPGAFQDAYSHQWLAGLAAGNPMSTIGRSKPLQEMSAHGFGSSTGNESTPSNANGVWSDGRWTVVFDRPFVAGDPLISRFQSNPGQQLIALAVWDGDSQNRGGRKQITNWLPMRIEP